MPLTKKGRSVLRQMHETYAKKGGPKKARSVFYAMIQSGKLKGAHK